MKSVYVFTERVFEKLTAAITGILGNSITFMIALVMVLFWWSNKEFYTENIHQKIGDIIFGSTFLSLFVIQKSFNKFTGSLHLKINELIASHDTASNAIIGVESKSEQEIMEMAKEHAELLAKLEEKDLKASNE